MGREYLYRKNGKKDGMKKGVALFMAGLILLLPLAGCEEITDSGEKSQTGQSQINDSEVKLDVWTFFDMNTPGTYYVDLWEELAEEKGYDINLKTYSTEQIKDKLKISLVCDELPDIFVVWGGSYPDFLFDANACLPVDEYLDEAGFEFKDSYVVPYKDGKNYIIPCLVEAYAVTYCNQDLMEMMGLTMPETWDELTTLVETVNKYNAEHNTGYAAIELGDKDNWLGELLYTMIVNRIDPYAQDKLAVGDIDFSNEVFEDAADKIMELVEMNAFPEDFLETGEVEAVENFINGEAVLFPHQSTIVYYLMENMGEDTFSMEQFPCCGEVFDENYASYMMDINHSLTPGLCISSDTEYADEAAELCLEFSQRVNARNVIEYDYLDMVKDSGLSTVYQSPLPVKQFHQMIDQAQKYTPFWYAVLNKEDGDNWRNLTKKLLGGAITKEDFLKEAEKYLNFSDST